MKNKRKLTVIILLALIVVFAALAIYINLRIQQNNSVKNSSANTVTPTLTSNDALDKCYKHIPDLPNLPDGTNPYTSAYNIVLPYCQGALAVWSCQFYPTDPNNDKIPHVIVSYSQVDALCAAANASSTSGNACTLNYQVGNASCHPILSYGGASGDQIAKSAAQNNIGTRFMTYCNGDGTPAYATPDSGRLSSCNCPPLVKPATGCVSNICSVCNNPEYLCADNSNGGGSSTPTITACGSCDAASYAADGSDATTIAYCQANPSKCAKTLDGKCSKVGYCDNNGPPPSAVGGEIYCQDPGGPKIPIQGVTFVISTTTAEGTPAGNSPQRSDSNGKFFFVNLQSFPHVGFISGISSNQAADSGAVNNWNAGTHPLANYTQTLPNGQPLSALTIPSDGIAQCINNSGDLYYQNNQSNHNFCNSASALDADRYGFELPSYVTASSPRYPLTYHLTNCSPPVISSSSSSVSSSSSSVSSSSSSATPPDIIHVKVLCQDAGGTAYPIAGAQIGLQASIGQTYSQNTDANGLTDYVLPSTSLQPMAIRIQNLPAGNLSTGQPYSSLVSNNSATLCSDGSVTKCTGGVPGTPGNFCSSNKNSYEWCSIPNGVTPGTFIFNLTNCTPPVISSSSVSSSSSSSSSLSSSSSSVSSSSSSSSLSSISSSSSSALPNQCLSLAKTGDPVTAGVGNVVQFSLSYQSSSSTNPLPNIKLRVGPAAAGVGRGFQTSGTGNNQGYVSPFSTPTYDSLKQVWSYTFEWEAANIDNSPVASSTYNVVTLSTGLDGSDIGAPCADTLTVSVGQQNPLFNVVKTSAPVCNSTGDQVISYTVKVTDIGPVGGTVSSIVDTYDPTAYSLGIIPTNISPSGLVANGQVTWANIVFTSQQSQLFTYQLTIPKSQLANFVNKGLENHVQVTYNTSTANNNSTSFNLNTMLTCGTPKVPNTGILDDNRFLLFGLFFVLAGYLTYKHKFGKNISDNFINFITYGTSDNIENFKKKFRPFEDSISQDLDKKRKK